jgi:alpha-L-fucosidase
MDPAGPDGGAAAPGYVRERELGTGHRNGKRWLPAEVDVSIRPGWFWHEKENAKVKTRATLMDIYFQSVGRGASLLLNVPPDRRGLVNEADAASLKQFGDMRRAAFGQNLAAGAKAKASNVRGGGTKMFRAENLLDGSRDTYWATDDAVHEAEVVFDLARETAFNVVRLREFLPLGQRIDAVAVDGWQGGSWQEIGKATSIGSCRLIRTGAEVKTQRVKLRVTQAAVCPALSEFALFMS